MDKKSIDYTLYLVTDRRLMSSKTVEESVASAIEGGASVVQLREKDCSSREFYELALRVKRITAPKNVPLLINDRIDICLAADADGVHLGQRDIPCAAARKILGADKIIGVSAALPEEAARAQLDGADYLGVGAVFPTGTKSDTRPVTPEIIREIRAAVSIPFVVIGGVNSDNIGQLYGLGINGAAVVSAIVSQSDVCAAARTMRRAAEKL
ncbi:MAG: thiamine phosphate synthase [Lachnospiraceae bacterium]|nr:thiamine phosphate synthase [Ruminococcus sp.]MCM1274837.1 thiamine phosphate synthase [Lachnospiraceae bacterium]